MKVEEELKVILEQIHLLQSNEIRKIKELRSKAHQIIIESTISYKDAYKIMKKHTVCNQEFNEVMGRVRNSILNKKNTYCFT